MKYELIFSILLLTGCVSSDTYPFHQASAEIRDGDICVYTKDAKIDDSIIAYGISRYPDWKDNENWVKIKPISAYNTCLPSYNYIKNDKYNVVYYIETAGKEKNCIR